MTLTGEENQEWAMGTLVGLWVFFFFFSLSNDSAEGILLIFHGRPQLRMG